MFVKVENSTFQGFHSPDVDYVTPSGAVMAANVLRQIPEADRNEIGLFTLHDGEVPGPDDDFTETTPALVGGVWCRQYSTTPKSAAAYREQFKRDIDAAAEAARLSFITPGAGQAAVYLEKKSQADQCLAVYSAGNPPPEGTFPLLDATVDIEIKNPIGPVYCANAFEVAEVVSAIAAQWVQAAATIEAKRLGGKKAADLATTMAELRAARDIDWSLS